MEDEEFPLHIQSIIQNIDEVDRLTEIHSEIGGEGPGRRHDVEVLNRSAIVLLVACWEAYVEDLATSAFEHLITETKEPSALPSKIRSLISADLKAKNDPCAIWELAGKGWKKVVRRYRDGVLDRYVGRLNTPRPKQVDSLFENMIALKGMSKQWKWKGCSNHRVLQRLEDLITLRGEIAHRVMAGTAVRKRDVDSARDLIGHLSASASNQVAEYLEATVGSSPFDDVTYGRLPLPD